MQQITAVIRQFNVVDLVFIFIALRMLYISSRTGFITEFFKLCGTLLAIYIAPHYFTTISDFMRNRYGVGEGVPRIPLSFMDFTCFIAVTIFGYLVAFLLREAFLKAVKMEAVPALHRWGGMALSLARSFLIAGLLTYILSVSTITYFRDRASSSFMGSRLWELVPNTYSGLWYGFTSKFMRGEKFNQIVYEAQRTPPEVANQ